MMKLLSFLISFSLICFSQYALATTSKIAVVLNKTGESQTNSEWMSRGIRVGVKRLAAQGINLELVYFDDKGTEKGALEVAKQINKRKDIAFVLAGYSSRTAIPLARNIPQLPIIDVFGSSLETIANKENHLPLVSDNDSQGRLLSSYVKNDLKKIRPCLVIEGDDGFSSEVRRGFETDQGKKVEATFVYNSRNKNEIVQALKSCQKLKADILVHSGRTQSIRFFLEQHLNASDVPVLGSDGWGDFEKALSPVAAKRMKETNAPVFFAYYWNEIATTKAQAGFVKAYSELFSDKASDTISALAHDAVIIAAGFLKNGKGTLKAYTQDTQPLIPLALLGEAKIQVPLKHQIYRLGSDGKTVLQTKSLGR